MATPHVDPFFGPLQPSADGYWSKVVSHGGAQVEVDLEVEDDVDGDAVGRLTARLRDLSGLESNARQAMRADLHAEESAVALYRSHHEAELSPAALAACFGDSIAWKTDGSAFVAGLRLKRVGLYPDDEDQAIHMDFTLGDSVSDYLLVVSFNGDGQVVAVDMES